MQYYVDLSNEELSYIIDRIKTIRSKSISGVVYIDNGVVYYIDDEYTILYTFNIDDTSYSIGCELAFLLSLDLTTEGFKRINNNWMVTNRCRYLISLYSSLEHNTDYNVRVISSEELETKPIRLTADDGIVPFYIDNCLIPSFSGIYKLNKGDYISGVLYRHKYTRINVIKYIVYKSKVKESFSIYMKLLAM